MVAVPRNGCTTDALRRAVAAEHEQCRPEFGKVTVRNLYGLRTHEAMGASQWVAVTDVALRHRARSRAPAGGARARGKAQDS